jgi:hypothetical protein
MTGSKIIGIRLLTNLMDDFFRGAIVAALQSFKQHESRQTRKKSLERKVWKEKSGKKSLERKFERDDEYKSNTRAT